MATKGVRQAWGAVVPPDAKAQLGYTTDAVSRHQWLRSSGTVAQIDFEPGGAAVIVRLAGRRHSLLEMGRHPGAPLRR